MKANEFVKKFGLDLAKLDVRAFESGFIKREDIVEHYGFDILDDLKRLVESHELVLEWKLPEDDEIGLDGANLYLDYYAHYTSDEEKAKLDRLKQAIADVESCMEGGK